ncbi:serine hydrolase [Polyangium spumosum]|uniref:serine hydrolase n=1 Tax=Polyangium spumosum TaxID=889282 RepID=UPI0014789403
MNIPSILADDYQDLSWLLSATHCGTRLSKRTDLEHEKGCIAAVVHGTRIVAIGASGLAYKNRSFWNAPNAPATKDMEINDAFQLGSVSKVYTVLALSKLIESAPTINGHTLTWESTLADAMPWVNLNTPEWDFRKQKKLKHLVSHRAGYCKEPGFRDTGYCSTRGAACTQQNEATVCDGGACGGDGTCRQKGCDASADCNVSGSCVTPAEKGRAYPTPAETYWKPRSPAEMREEVSLFYNDSTNGVPNCPVPITVDYDDGNDNNDEYYSNTGIFMAAAVIDYWSQTGLESYLQTAQPWGPNVSNTFLGYPAGLDRDSTAFTGNAAEKANWLGNLFDESHPMIVSKNYAIENGYSASGANTWNTRWVSPAPQGSYAVNAYDAARFLIRMNRELAPEIKRMTRDSSFFSSTGRNLALNRSNTTSLGFVRNRKLLHHRGVLYGSTWYQFVPESDIAYIAFVHNTGDDTGAVGKVVADLKRLYPFKNNLGVCDGWLPSSCEDNEECDSGVCNGGLCAELRCDSNADCPVTGSCESTSELAVSHGCTDADGGGVSNVQRFYTNPNQALSGTKMFGCSGAVTWQDRATLCAPGFHVCEASEYVNLNTDNERPLYNYWTDDNLGYLAPSVGGMPPSGSCTVGTGPGYWACGLGRGPMRVTTDDTTDALGRDVNIIECGLNGSLQNKWFGGCATTTTNNTAGTLCCGDRAYMPPTPEPSPPGPPDECPVEGCGTTEGGLCATVQLPYLSPLDEYRHPDGNFASDKYCLDDYPDAGIERVCVAYGTNPNQSVGVCRTCTDDAKWPGCECNPNNPDSCGAQTPALVCIPTTGYDSNGQGTFSSGKCALASEPLPSWDCPADCTKIYGDTGYCYHREEGGLFAMCADELDGLDGVICAISGTVWNGSQCVNECASTAQCHTMGYPSAFVCNQDGRCVL